MSESEKNQALDMFDELQKKYGDELKAAEATFDSLKYQAYLRRKDRAVSAQRYATMVNRIEDFAQDRKRYGHALLGIVSSDAQGTKLNFNLEDRAEYYRGEIMSYISDLVEEYGKKGILGMRGNKNSYGDLLKEAEAISLGQGPVTQNKKARAFAESWLAAAERGRQLKNKFGGHTPKMEGWFIPQSHSSQKVSSVSLDEWKDFIMPKLDKEKIVDFETNQPITDLRLDVLLNDVYNAITRGGYVGTAKKSYGRALERNRVLKFKNAESWIKYNNMFGDTDVFATMLEHADKLGRDIAELEILGPQPQKTLDQLSEYVREKASKDASINIKGIDKLQTYYDVFKRKQLLVASEWLANIGSSVRNVLTSAFLGKAVFSALGDTGTTSSVMKRLGKSGAQPVARLLKSIQETVLDPMSAKERRQFLMKSGIILSDMVNIAHQSGRMAGEADGPVWSQVAADVSLRAQGLTHWTQGMRNANAMEGMHAFAANLSKSFDELDPELKITLRRYELDKDWDILRQVKPTEYKGELFLTKNDIQNLNTSAIDPDVLAANYGSMIANLVNDAVIMGNIKTAANLSGAAARGTATGELFRSAFMFKTFPVTVFMQHIWRMFTEQGINKKVMGMDMPVGVARAYRIGSFVGVTWMAGALAEQLHAMAKGKDPQDMTTPEFWSAALVRGGGMGFVGDIISNQFKGYGQELLGPVGKFAGDTVQLTAGNVLDYLSGEDPKFADDLLRYLKAYTPGNSLWYLELAADRIIMEQVAETIDPGISNRLQSNATRQESRTNQRYWWSPGRTSPERGPNFDAISGQ